ncbi:unnamed protein product [Acanthoscelides obtectus]|uniref:PiggyBac transposable element-derived protein domain-containing protein n=1 Tax=Acanthoscelides obtectus TaxID=200917 RepID=A0A9P0L5U0_ACAOB|nr:unnamed protein product [Acanthoscelides obtectus]CAK1625084.1 hypothetical protein AOBTE_LOCUS2942 [Acanthoscelides obtectus]
MFLLYKGERKNPDKQKDFEKILKKEMAYFESDGTRGEYVTLAYEYILTVQPTSLEAESAFSASGYICSSLRSRLGDGKKIPLLEKNTYCTGTLRAGGKETPEDVSKAKLKPGESVHRYGGSVCVAVIHKELETAAMDYYSPLNKRIPSRIEISESFRGNCATFNYQRNSGEV